MVKDSTLASRPARLTSFGPVGGLLAGASICTAGHYVSYSRDPSAWRIPVALGL